MPSNGNRITQLTSVPAQTQERGGWVSSARPRIKRIELPWHTRTRASTCNTPTAAGTFLGMVTDEDVFAQGWTNNYYNISWVVNK
jgi:hypothetical protein